MNKLKLEDVTRERDELLAEKENAAKRQEAQAKWNALLSPKGVLERAGLTSVADVVDLQAPATAAETVERVAEEARNKIPLVGCRAKTKAWCKKTANQIKGQHKLLRRRKQKKLA